MDHPDLQDVFRENAWRHFAIHAEQRLKMFQFYITISTALLGGGVLLIRTGQNAIALLLLSFLASFFSFVFWKLEIRTRILVKNSEDAIKYLDRSYDVPDVDRKPSPLKLFTRDDSRTQSNKRFSAPFALQLSQVLRHGIRGHRHSGCPRHGLWPHRNFLYEFNLGTTPRKSQLGLHGPFASRRRGRSEAVPSRRLQRFGWHPPLGHSARVPVPS